VDCLLETIRKEWPATLMTEIFAIVEEKRVVSDNEKELEDENYTQGILLNSDSRNNLGVRSDI
jgi:hypothetical protein